eukprot:m.914628 g.914628  ORF g.914628 m.914628 type:complete len:84 (-) comp60142_c0_seq8:5736-5987(-)
MWIATVKESPEPENGHTRYTVQIVLATTSYSADWRHSDLLALHTALSGAFPTEMQPFQAEFPQKRAFLTPAARRDRVVKLDNC